MAIELEQIQPWDGQSGTGSDARIVIDGNFEKIKNELETVDSKLEETNEQIVQLAGEKADKNDLVIENLLNNDLSNFYMDKRLNANGSYLMDNTGFSTIVTSKAIPVYAGMKLALSGALHVFGDGVRGTFASDDACSTNLTAPIWTEIASGWSTVSPMNGYLFVDYDLNVGRTSLLTESQIEYGETVSPYVAYDDKSYRFLTNEINKDNPSFKGVSEIAVKNQLLFRDDTIVEVIGKNRINPQFVNFSKYFSPGSNSLASNSGSRYCCVKIPISNDMRGEFMTLSPLFPDPFIFMGAYYNSDTQITADEQVSESTVSVDNTGRYITISTNPNYNFLYLNLVMSDIDSGVLNSQYQFEIGEVGTLFEPYSVAEKINKSLLYDNKAPDDISVLDDYIKLYNLPHIPVDKALVGKFIGHCIKKDKDVTVVQIGTSLTGRTDEHCTEHKGARFRPPLMHSNNFNSYIWDILKWEGQEYRRYDSGFFKETGSWVTKTSDSAWDDSGYRNGYTRVSDDISGTIQFQAPIGASQFNLIYRTDFSGSEDCKIAISGGNGKMEVLNDSGNWVEANNYVFSQKEHPETLLPSITYTNPITGEVSTIDNYKVKGNTLYQKRLKMRCKSSLIDSRSEAKGITISRTSGRLMYWGVEWSNRDHMITYISAARGSHNMTIESPMGLSHFQDNEVWSFMPDLLLVENPIHNSGASGSAFSAYPSSFWEVITKNFFTEDNAVSLKGRAAALGLIFPEAIVFNSSVTWNFGAIDDSGQLILSEDKEGNMLTAVDAQNRSNYALGNSGMIVLNLINNWIDAAINVYGNLKTATEGSGKDGLTFTNEGSHWNDTGSKIQARVIMSLFKSLLI